MSEKITIGGRTFTALEETTVEHDHWVMALLREAGIDVALRQPEEPAEAYARRLLSIALASGKTCLFLGGMLMPEDAAAPWSPALAEETARFLSGLTAPEDKEQINRLIVLLIADFFAAGLIFSGASPSSSQDQPGAGNQAGDGANGPTWSGSFRAATPSAGWRSRVGRWMRRWWRFARSAGGRTWRTTGTAR